jgi:hypothetical protein
LAVGFGVGFAVGLGLGFDVGLGLGFAEALGLGFGVGEATATTWGAAGWARATPGIPAATRAMTIGNAPRVRVECRGVLASAAIVDSDWGTAGNPSRHRCAPRSSQVSNSFSAASHKLPFYAVVDGAYCT